MRLWGQKGRAPPSRLWIVVCRREGSAEQRKPDASGTSWGLVMAVTGTARGPRHSPVDIVTSHAHNVHMDSAVLASKHRRAP